MVGLKANVHWVRTMRSVLNLKSDAGPIHPAKYGPWTGASTQTWTRLQASSRSFSYMGCWSLLQSQSSYGLKWTWGKQMQRWEWAPMPFHKRAPSNSRHPFDFVSINNNTLVSLLCCFGIRNSRVYPLLPLYLSNDWRAVQISKALSREKRRWRWEGCWRLDAWWYEGKQEYESGVLVEWIWRQTEFRNVWSIE
jgi:hypothetical protein